MTDQHPPQEHPDFQPPGWQPPQPQPQPPQPQPGYSQGQPQPPQQPYAPGQPGYPPPPYRQPVPPPRGGRGSIWLGIGITVAVLATSWALTTVPYGSTLASLANTIAAVLPFALVLAGIVMAAIPRTTRTGAGMLLGIGALILIAGGLCVALIAGINVGAR